MVIDYKKPIPANISIDSWKNVSIKECGEKLISFNDFKTGNIEFSPQYFMNRLPNSIDKCYLRESVAGLLVKASKNLPKGYIFLIWDAWRPLGLQQALFDKYKNKIYSEGKIKDDCELLKLVEKFVSLPSKDSTKPSPHLTGGAVDLTILDGNKQELEMGTEFDFFGKEAKTDFYELKQMLTEKEIVFRQNRRILYYTLISAGFTNYPQEWWHFDYGNQFWGIQTNRKAIYNKISI